MANKVRFGLRNVKYAIYNPTSHTFGAVQPFPGAMSLSLTREGSDATDIYADDGIYYSFAGTNGGYTAELEMARITAAVRTDLLGEIMDSESGAQFEYTEAEPAIFCLIFETQGDEGPTGFAFYSCKASRPEMSANTKNESPTVDSDTLSIRMTSLPVTHNGSTKSIVQSHIVKNSTNAAKYEAFFAGVVVPGTIVDADGE